MSRVFEPSNIEIGGAGAHENCSIFDAGVYFAGHGTNRKKKKNMKIRLRLAIHLELCIATSLPANPLNIEIGGKGGAAREAILSTRRLKV